MNHFLTGLTDFFPTTFPVALLVMGGLFRACAARHRLAVEEQLRLQLITEAAARRELFFVRWIAPALMAGGVAYSVSLHFGFVA